MYIIIFYSHNSNFAVMAVFFRLAAMCHYLELITTF